MGTRSTRVGRGLGFKEVQEMNSKIINVKTYYVGVDI
jgi:hypothetical protein